MNKNWISYFGCEIVKPKKKKYLNFLASSFGHFEIVELLLKNKADANLKSNNECTALYIGNFLLEILYFPQT